MGGSGRTNPSIGNVVPIDSIHQTVSLDWNIGKKPKDEPHEEGRLSFVLQVGQNLLHIHLQTFFPFLLAGFGMVGAGILLDRASGWYFLSEMPEALIMVPALLGLKGNLEMTLASRLSTMANLGQMDTRSQQISVLVSNLALVQTQAIVVSLAASLLTIGTSLAEGRLLHAHRIVSLMLIAIGTASVASFILSTVMVFLAILAKHLKINPDNVSTPIAAMLGDVTTLAFMIFFGTVLTKSSESLFGLQIALLTIFLLSTVVWGLAASKNPVTCEVLKHGWYIVFVAMLISSAGGYVLKLAFSRFNSLAVFQPVINGVGGNLVAVQASKISTYLHKYGQRGVLPENDLATYANPVRTFSMKEEESVHANFLLLMSIPGHTIFLTLIFFIELGDIYGWRFYMSYILIGLLQLSCRVMWRCKLNPDNNAIPLMTSLGDLVGTSLLFVMYLVMNAISSVTLIALEEEADEAGFLP